MDASIRLLGLVCALLLSFGVACKDDNRTGGDSQGTGDTGVTTVPTDTSATSPTDTSTSEGSEAGPVFDVGNGETGSDTEGECNRPGDPDATLVGTVFAPNQVIPVSGALVYTSDTAPTGIPQEVYCAECVQLPCEIPFVLTEPDGSFSLPTESGMKYVVVQKGQFMRITQMDISPGQNDIDETVTSLPDHNDPANGLYIPKIALGIGSYDRLEDGLGKLGLGDTTIDMNFNGETIVPGTEQFDVWENGSFGWGGMTQGTFGQLVDDYELMKQYHIIFVPCSNDSYLSDVASMQGLQNIRDWVAAGGKWYVADWSNEYMDAPFGQYQTFFVDDWGDTDLGWYDSIGEVLDADLLAWLQALPQALKDINPQNGGGNIHPTINNLPSIDLVDNWSGIMNTPPVMVDDGMGGMVDVGHYTWIEGPGDGFDVPVSDNPMTVTGQYGCGKIMFTTYHTAEGGSYIGLTPQELVLMYLILEIGVCQTPTEPPPPEG